MLPKKPYLERLQWVYITTKNKEEAQRMGRDLLTKRLAACINILGPLTSMYWWEGAIEQDEEVALIAKTRASHMDQLIVSVRNMHPYSCPCIIALPIQGGSDDFLQWILQETSSTRRKP